MMATGAVNVVRGSRSSVGELLQIYNHSERLMKYHFKVFTVRWIIAFLLSIPMTIFL